MSLSNKNKAVLFLVVGLGLLINGCDNSSSNGASLNPTQANIVGKEVGGEIQLAMLAALNSANSSLGAAVAKGGVKAAAAAPPTITANCNATATGESCTYSGTLACLDQGTIAVSGTAVGTLNASGTGSMQAQATFIPSACSGDDVVILVGGNPSLTVSATVIFTNGTITYPLDLTETGDLTFAPGSAATSANTVPDGSCQFDITSVFNGTDFTLSGTACSQSITGTYPIPTPTT